MSRVVIIGASIAGHTVAVNLRERNKDCRITLVTEEDFPVYDKRRLPELLAGNIREKDIFLAGENFYKDRDISFINARKVSLVNTEKNSVSFKDCPFKDSLEYDFLVVCSGRRFSLPEIPGVRKEGVFKLDSLSETRDFSGHLNMSEQACVVGSNVFAVNTAKAIVSKQKEVKLISPEGLDAASVPEGVEVINSQVTEIIGESEVLGIRLKEGKIIGTPLVCFMDKFKANTEFLKGGGIEMKGDSILVDGSMRTNRKNVFASGAVCGSGGPGFPIKGWDDTINESLLLVDNLVKII